MRQRVTSHSFASLAATRIPVTGNLLRLAHLSDPRRRGRAFLSANERTRVAKRAVAELAYTEIAASPSAHDLERKIGRTSAADEVSDRVPVNAG
jgi:hypothetical protein